MPGVNNIDIASLYKYFKQAFGLLLSNWKVLSVAGVLGAGIGFTIAYFNKPDYTASLSFVLNENEGTGSINLSALAGIAGFGGIGSGVGNVNEEKLLFISGSKTIFNQAIVKKCIIAGKTDLIANHIIDIFELEGSFKSDTLLKNFNRFQSEREEKLTIQERIVADKIYRLFSKGQLFQIESKKKAGIVAQGTGILIFSFKSKSEELSSAFIESIYNVVCSYYTAKVIQRQQKNYELIKFRADSIHKLLFLKENSGAKYFDSNHGLIRMQQRIELERSKREVEIYSLMYAEVLKNLEVAKFVLESQTPLFQVIDRPDFPLEKKKLSKLISAIGGSTLLLLLASLFILIRKSEKWMSLN